MAFKKNACIAIVLCLMATLAVVMSGCDDLGAYEDTEEYYDTFGDIVLISGSSKEEETYSVKEYFYNSESREDFLKGEDGAYEGVEPDDYVYMVIPFENSIEIDSLALFLQSQNDVTVFINVFVINATELQAILNYVKNGEGTGVYDGPDPETRVGNFNVPLKSGKWNSFMLDTFRAEGTSKKSMEIKDGQYILLQFMNNVGALSSDEDDHVFVDPQTGLELQKAEITMTNLLIRALDVKNENEVQGGE